MDSVHVGADGWMFLTGGTNNVLRYFRDADFFAAHIPAWHVLLEERVARARALGALYRHVIVPDKLGVYTAESGLEDIDPARAPACALRAALGTLPGVAQRLLPVLPALREVLLAARADGVQTHFRTDAHWTFEGCYLAYQVLCASVGATPRHDLPQAPRLHGDLFLDLGSKLDPPVTEDYVTSLFFSRARRVAVNDVVAFKEAHNRTDVPGLHVGSNVVFENDSPGVDPRTVVLFGDSYSEYRTHQLTGMLAETFASVHFVWSSSLDWSYIERVRPDILFTEMAERFMNIVPGDALDLPAFSAERLREHLAQQPV